MEKYIERTIYPKLKKHLAEKEITVIIGPRQAGKTTLLKKLIRELPSQSVKSFYFNLDLESDKSKVNTQDKLLFLIKQELTEEIKRLYLFIDEMQVKENAGIFLKGVYDYIDFNDLSVKLVVTGSGSFELKEKIKESLVGRKKIFELKTISFYEFLQYKEKLDTKEKIIEFARLFPDKLLAYLQLYANYGGYPKVVLHDNLQKKHEALQDIYNSYLETDIKKLLKVEKTRAFKNLVKILAYKVGSLVNKAELSRILGIAQNTVDSYLMFLEKTYVINLVPPFYRNPRKEITKMPIVFFNDLGLRAFVSADFNFAPLTSDRGGIFENYIYRLLTDTLPLINKNINYWRTLTGAEVDFVIGTYKDPIPVEVKMRKFKGKPSYGKSFYSFLEKYKPKNAYLYNLDTRKQTKIKETKVTLLPYYLPPR